jgi:hypothetical protein
MSLFPVFTHSLLYLQLIRENGISIYSLKHIPGNFTSLNYVSIYLGGGWISEAALSSQEQEAEEELL